MPTSPGPPRDLLADPYTFGRHGARLHPDYQEHSSPLRATALAALAQSRMAAAITAHLDRSGAGLTRQGVAQSAGISSRHLFGILTGRSWASLHDIVGLSLAMDAKLITLTTSIGSLSTEQTEADPSRVERDARRNRRQ